MSDKHTPGPWFARRDEHSATWPREVADDRDRQSGKQICCVARRAAGEADANARLIAAAPDLLAALQVIASAPTVGGISAGERKGMERCAAIARAAIAKAEGR